MTRVSKTKSVVSKVKAKRTRRRFSIRETALMVGVSFSTLARLERGEGGPSPLVERKLQAWLGEEVDTVTIEERLSALEGVKPRRLNLND